MMMVVAVPVMTRAAVPVVIAAVGCGLLGGGASAEVMAVVVPVLEPATAPAHVVTVMMTIAIRNSSSSCCWWGCSGS